MATVAHGPTSSNNQRGTVGLSAGDWIRIKRLQGARNYSTTIANNTDVNVPTARQTAYSVPLLKAKHTGASRIRRTNEQWINYRASQTGDFVRNTGERTSIGYPRILFPTRICNCSVLSSENYVPKLAGGKCCIGKPKSRYDGFIEVGTGVAQCQNVNDFKLYTFTPSAAGTYTITANSVSGSNPDLFVSYPGVQINTAGIVATGNGDTTVSLSNKDVGTSQIGGAFEAGKIYEVMVFQFGGSCFNLTVTS
jgi:hypothetical protein